MARVCHDAWYLSPAAVAAAEPPFSAIVAPSVLATPNGPVGAAWVLVPLRGSRFGQVILPMWEGCGSVLEVAGLQWLDGEIATVAPGAPPFPAPAVAVPRVVTYGGFGRVAAWHAQAWRHHAILDFVQDPFQSLAAVPGAHGAAARAVGAPLAQLRAVLPPTVGWWLVPLVALVPAVIAGLWARPSRALRLGGDAR